MSRAPLLWVCDNCREGIPTDLNSCSECGASRPAICEYRRGDAVTDQRVVALGLAMEAAGYVILMVWAATPWPLVLGLWIILGGREVYKKGSGI